MKVKAKNMLPVVFPPVSYNEKSLLMEDLDVREVLPGPFHEPLGYPCRQICKMKASINCH